MTVIENLYQAYQQTIQTTEKARLAFEIGQYEFIKDNISTAVQFAQEILDLIDNTPDSPEYYQLKGDGYSHAGFISNLSGNVMLSLEQLQKAEDYYQQIRDEASLADVTMRLGSAHWNIGNYEKGLNYALKAVKESERVGDKRVFASSIVQNGQLTRIKGSVLGDKQLKEKNFVTHQMSYQKKTR